jgi:hypothetical protein
MTTHYPERSLGSRNEARAVLARGSNQKAIVFVHGYGGNPITTARYIPPTFPPAFRDRAIWHLSHPAVRRYYEVYYPLYLPYLFRRRLAGEMQIWLETERLLADPTWLQNSCDFSDCQIGADDVFEHILSQEDVKGSIGKSQSFQILATVPVFRRPEWRLRAYKAAPTRERTAVIPEWRKMAGNGRESDRVTSTDFIVSISLSIV